MALIYVVEDDKNIQEIETFALANVGYEVKGFDSATDFYAALNETAPDLILLDYEMPIVDGRQFMQMIREDTEFQNIPIIFLTGKNDAQTVMDVMSLKPNGYLLKSMDAQKLHAAIDDFFKKQAK